MSNEKQTANEILAKQKEIASIIFDRNWHILNKNNDELLLSVIEEDMIIDSHIEYANQQTSEMHKQAEKDSRIIGTLIKQKESLQNALLDVTHKAIELKQSADEMANSLKKYMIGTEIEFEVVAALENYKKLI